MKVFYFGGQKSGKSNLAEQQTLTLSGLTKPYYIATYDDSYGDSEMQKRILDHKVSREDNFITIEETLDLSKVIKSGNTYLVDCLSMWILNNIDNREVDFINQLDYLLKIDANIVFVLNDTTQGIIPIDKISRRYVDLTGIVGQKIAKICDNVYEVKFGIPIQLK